MKLIDKDALVAEIENIRKHYIERDDFDNGWNFALDKVLSFIDTLEVKEVDLEYLREELDKAVKIYKPDGDFGWGTLYNIATHFFELGLNASNPLTWEDVKLIWTIGDEIPYMPEEDFFKELLKRFKAQKGEKE